LDQQDAQPGFRGHIAILDSVTGSGVLVLPDQVDEDELADTLG
jgi:hypothetical protein